MAQSIVAAEAEGRVLALGEGLSFWGGVDPTNGRVIDAHHPSAGQCLAGKIVMMLTSRGSCSGSGVLLELALNGHAPAGLIFREAEDILTLGAEIAMRMFGKPLAVVRLEADEYDALALAANAHIDGTSLTADGLSIKLDPLRFDRLTLSDTDQSMLDGNFGTATQLAMQTVCAMAASQGAETLIDVTRVHIDGCIYASPANLRFAETMTGMGAQVRVPTTMNAISVDHRNWRTQGIPECFGLPASQLADAYVQMGAQPSFTCAPYLLDGAPSPGECIAWAESNAVVFANSVLGARTVKHPDFLDLCIALTGRAPLSGVYLDEERLPRRTVQVELPDRYDDSFWPLLGYLAGQLAPDRIPLLIGLEASAPSQDDLKALCAAFGTTSAAPMLHIADVTPETPNCELPEEDIVVVTRADLLRVWEQFNLAPSVIDLVAFGSPHFSARECKMLADLMDGRSCHPDTATMVTMGRAELEVARSDGSADRLEASGIRIVTDICWCSISEPVFPPSARVVMTNSGKYAHYGPGLSGRAMRFGSMSDCAAAAVTGKAPRGAPHWLTVGQPPP